MSPNKLMSLLKGLFKAQSSREKSPDCVKRTMAQKVSKRHGQLLNVKKFWDRAPGTSPTTEAHENSLSHWNAVKHEFKSMVPIEDRAVRKHTFSIDPQIPLEDFSSPEQRLLHHLEERLHYHCAEESLYLHQTQGSELQQTEGHLQQDMQQDKESHLHTDEEHSLREPRVPCELCDTLLADDWNVNELNSLIQDCTDAAELVLEAPKRAPQTTEYEEDYDYEEELLPYFTESLLDYEEEINLDNLGVNLEGDDGAVLQALIEALAEPTEDDVKQAQESLLTPNTELEAEEPYKNFSDNALKLIAQKLETPAATLVWLSSHANPHVRAAVARNASTPSDTIILLSKDYEAGIRHCIAENTNSPIQALHLLVRDRNPLIAWRAQQTLNQVRGSESSQSDKRREPMQQTSPVQTQRPTQPANKMNEEQQNSNNSKKNDEQRCHEHTKVKVHSAECDFARQKAQQPPQSEETVAFLQLIARKTNTPNRRLAELATNPDARIRAAVGENANAPSEILWLLAKDKESAVKLKLIDNYNCPLEILEALREDEDEFVAYQAHTALMRIIGACTDNHIRTVTWP